MRFACAHSRAQALWVSLMSTSQIPIFKMPFRHYLREHPRAFSLGVLALFLTNLFDVLTPLGIKAGIDALEQKDSGKLLQAVLVYFLLMTGVTSFRFLWRIFFGKFHHSVAEDLRNRIFDKLASLGPSYFSKTPVGQLLSLLTNDVNTFRMAIGPGLLITLDAVFYIGMILPIMISISWDWTWKSLLILPAVPFFMRKMENLIHERFRTQQDRLSEMSGRAAEVVSGIRPIKSFAQEENQAQAFNVFSRKFEDACNRAAQADAFFHPSMQVPIAFGSVILLWFCTPEVMRNEVTLGTFVAFHEYIRRMVWPMNAIGMGVSLFEQGRASFDRIRDLLSTETDIPDLGDQTVNHFKSLAVKNLNFRYPGANDNVLKNVSLTLRAGETVGLVGPVGSGKSTLLYLLCRLYPSKTGEIQLNGIDIDRIKRSSLSSTISLVPQEAFLFSDSISENVTLGLSDFPGLESVKDATSAVNIDHEIQQLPEGYSAYLGERGVNLSGGQKQRLTIARALIRHSPVVMFDDSLSAVDGKTEQSIVKELKVGRARHPEQAVLLVSHRLATLRHSDRIIVLNLGQIEAEGTHEQLLEMSPTYRRLNELQDASAEGSSIWDSVQRQNPEGNL